MGEKRKPILTILLRKEGKRLPKIELYPIELWGDKFNNWNSPRYRLRINGKWFKSGEQEIFSKWEFRDLLFRSILKNA